MQRTAKARPRGEESCGAEAEWGKGKATRRKAAQRQGLEPRRKGVAAQSDARQRRGVAMLSKGKA
jgi:hypothetical protein